MIEYTQYRSLPANYITDKINSYLSEDIPNGDLTTSAISSLSKTTNAYIQAESAMVMAGADVIKHFFPLPCNGEVLVRDSVFVESGTILAKIEGPAGIILTRERPFLNLIQRLSGIATETKKYADIAKPYNVKILDTRKTTPGLRLFEKYAVTVGGGYNHRLDLSSGILIKDNHIKAAGGIKQAVSSVRRMSYNLPIELEVENFDEIRDGMEIGVEGFLVDNMSPDTVIRAVELIRSYENGENIFIEASGGITLETLPEYVKTGINAISVGALTHSVKSANIHLEFL
jgi:nicotinate-nucleotide pyrophosphorylase (carboxylating)